MAAKPLHWKGYTHTHNTRIHTHIQHIRTTHTHTHIHIHKHTHANIHTYTHLRTHTHTGPASLASDDGRVPCVPNASWHEHDWHDLVPRRTSGHFHLVCFVFTTFLFICVRMNTIDTNLVPRWSSGHYHLMCFVFITFLFICVWMNMIDTIWYLAEQVATSTWCISSSQLSCSYACGWTWLTQIWYLADQVATSTWCVSSS